MSTLLIKNISQLVTCDDSDQVLQNVDVLCKDGFIKRECLDRKSPVKTRRRDGNGLTGIAQQGNVRMKRLWALITAAARRLRAQHVRQL